MRKLALSLGLIAGTASSAAAQDPMPWTNEIGLNFNYTVTTVNDQDLTTVGFPSGNGYVGIGGVAGAYGVIPINTRWAVEPSLTVSDIGVSGTSITTLNFTGRVLFSAWRGVYVAGGPSLAMLRLSGDQTSTWGYNVAAGYRRRLTPGLMARGEVYYEAMGENELVAADDYSSIGLKLGLGLTPSAASSARGSRNDVMWPLAIGFQAGYNHVTVDAGGDLTIFSFPGMGSAVVAGSLPLSGVSPLFVQIPVGERFAIEPSVGYSSFDVDGSTSASTQSLGVRGLYAFNRNLYAGVSYDYIGYGGDLDLDATTGFGVAGGFRFPLMSGFTGRAEISYKKMSADDASFGDYTDTGLTFGVSAPIR